MKSTLKLIFTPRTCWLK